jgi:hypothetical protein
MTTRNDVLRDMVDALDPMSPGETRISSEIDFHLLSVMCILSVRSDVMIATFPIGGGVSTVALRALGVDPVRVPDSAIARLAPYREAFAAVQRAWLEFAAYRNPPCPPNPIAADLVEFTKTLALPNPG